jgi:hypothetical protein
MMQTTQPGMSRLFLSALVGFMIIVYVTVLARPAYAHYFGSTVNADNYQVVFSPYPSLLKADDNSTTLNFSVLDKDGNNLNNIYSALVITEKQSGQIIDQVPYSLFEFSDISIKYTFPKPGDYVVTLQTRIQDDPKYRASPLFASFTVSAVDPKHVIPFDELMLFYVTPAAVVIAGIAVYLRSKNKL